MDESNEAMHRMAGLLADFIIECYAYVNANSNDFTWRGADVHPLDFRYGEGIATKMGMWYDKNKFM